ncbi:hypothetical protein [Methylobacterium sp. A54F]
MFDILLDLSAPESLGSVRRSARRRSLTPPLDSVRDGVGPRLRLPRCFSRGQLRGTTVISSTTPSSSTTQSLPPERRKPLGRHAAGVRQSRVHAPPIGTRRPETPNRRVLDIEDVLRWAFREELPKRRDDADGQMRAFPSISPMFAMAALGGRVENFSREPGFPLAMGDPHPDALIVEAAVLDLQRFAQHRFAGDLGLLTYLPPGLDEHAVMSRAMEQIVDLVRIKVRLGSRPTFAASPIPAAIVDRRGRPRVVVQRMENRVDGFGRIRSHPVEEPCGAEGRDRYPKGAYCPVHWDDPNAILFERAEYATYWAALDLLAHELAGKLASIAVLPPAAAQRPWAGEMDAAKPKRILDAPASRAKLRDQQETELARRLLAHRRRSTPSKPRQAAVRSASATI